MSIKGRWDVTRREITNVERRIQTISKDQDRLRQNLREMPKESEAYKTYLKKFDDQEKEMTSLHEKLKNLQTQEEADRAAFETFLANLTVE
jgi:septal ring factor EnvC (AmiA/AmiB activator)